MAAKALDQKGAGHGSATAVAVGERLLDSIFFVAALAFFLIFSNFLTSFGLKIGAIFFVLLFLLLTFLWQLVRRPEKIAGFIQWLKKKTGNRPIIVSLEREIWLFRKAGIHLARETLRCTPVIAALTALIWMCDFLVPSALLVGMGADPDFLLSITSQIILAIIAILPLTPGSSGVAERFYELPLLRICAAFSRTNSPGRRSSSMKRENDTGRTRSARNMASTRSRRPSWSSQGNLQKMGVRGPHLEPAVVELLKAKSPDAN